MRSTFVVVGKVTIAIIGGYLLYMATDLIGAYSVSCGFTPSGGKESSTLVIISDCMRLVRGFPFHDRVYPNLIFWIVIVYIFVEIIFITVKKIKHHA